MINKPTGVARRPRPAVLALLLLMAACSTGDDGVGSSAQPSASDPSEESASPTVSASGSPSPSVVEAQVPAGGACFHTNGAVSSAEIAESDPVDCAEPHTHEAFLYLSLQNVEGSPFEFAELACVRRAADFLGSRDWPASLVEVFSVPVDRTADDHFGCAAYVGPILGAEGGEQTGSLRGALEGGGFDAYRACSNPGERTSSCDEPHVFEHVPPIFDLATAATRPDDESLAVLAAKCPDYIAAHLGGALRADVRANWFAATPEEWDEGSRYVICLAETEEPVVGSLAGIGTAPLPLAAG